jgi:ABC-type amino acid transport system permease subunit
MAGADQPVPTADAPRSSSLATGNEGLPPARSFLRRRAEDGTAIVVALCVPVVAVFGFLAVLAAHEHHWGDAARNIWLAAGFLGIPTLGLMLLGRVLRRRTPRRDQ